MYRQAQVRAAIIFAVQIVREPTRQGKIMHISSHTGFL